MAWLTFRECATHRLTSTVKMNTTFKLSDSVTIVVHPITIQRYSKNEFGALKVHTGNKITMNSNTGKRHYKQDTFIAYGKKLQSIHDAYQILCVLYS